MTHQHLSPAYSHVPHPTTAANAIAPPLENPALLNITKMLGANDIFVLGELSERAEWIVIHAGQKCVDLGVDVRTLLATPLRNQFGTWSPNVSWVRPPYADRDEAILTIMLRGAGRENFIVALLFDVPTADSQTVAEEAVEEVRPLLSSILDLGLQTTHLQMRLDGSNAALDHSDAGILLLDDSCNVVYENVTAQRLLDCGAGLRRRGRSIAANDMADAVHLRVAIEHVLSADDDHCVPLFKLKRGDGQRPLLASVMSARPKSGSANAVSMLIFLFDPERKIAHLLRSACQLYGLSPVETSLACHLACGESIASAAAALHIKELTARGYLKQIFIKTGVNRQAGLVQLLLSSIIHLGDDPQLLVI